MDVLSRGADAWQAFGRPIGPEFAYNRSPTTPEVITESIFWLLASFFSTANNDARYRMFAATWPCPPPSNEKMVEGTSISIMQFFTGKSGDCMARSSFCVFRTTYDAMRATRKVALNVHKRGVHLHSRWVCCFAHLLVPNETMSPTYSGKIFQQHISSEKDCRISCPKISLF